MESGLDVQNPLLFIDPNSSKEGTIAAQVCGRVNISMSECAACVPLEGVELQGEADMSFQPCCVNWLSTAA